jgi:hypothetical protein
MRSTRFSELDDILSRYEGETLPSNLYNLADDIHSFGLRRKYDPLSRFALNVSSLILSLTAYILSAEDVDSRLRARARSLAKRTITRLHNYSYL